MSTTVEGASFGGASGAAIVSNVFRFDWMAAAFGVFTLVYLSGRFFPKIKLSLIGLAVGMAMPLPFTTSLFLGGLIANTIRRWKGEEWFNSNRYVIVAGLAMGMGVVLGLFASGAALINSLVNLPY